MDVNVHVKHDKRRREEAEAAQMMGVRKCTLSTVIALDGR